MSQSSNSIAEGSASSISNVETTSDTAQLLSNEEEASTSNHPFNKTINFEVLFLIYIY